MCFSNEKQSLNMSCFKPNFIYIIGIVLLFNSPIHASPPNSPVQIVVLKPDSKTIDLVPNLYLSTDDTPDLNEITKRNHFLPLTDFKENLQRFHYYWYRPCPSSPSRSTSTASPSAKHQRPPCETSPPPSPLPSRRRCNDPQSRIRPAIHSHVATWTR